MLDKPSLMPGLILVLNNGSSTLKYSLFQTGDSGLSLQHHGQVEGPIEISTLTDLLRKELRGEQPAAVGHRVVHGGADYIQPIQVTAHDLAQLKKLIPLAPLHQPQCLQPIEILLERLPDVPQVACFDTAFHSTQPEIAFTFALPEGITESGLRRYGFHGLSYAYISSQLAAVDERAARGKTVVLHLGNGASMCALDAGRSIATTMGFSTLDGLVMGTRCGSLDPGVILYLMAERKLTLEQVETLLYKQSGLLGVSGISGDMRVLLSSAEPRAHLAVDLFLYRIKRELGSLTAALGGLDALVFTAGIGEHSPVVRERICADAAWLGVELDSAANKANGPRVSDVSSKVSAWVIPTNEELMIAQHTTKIVSR